MILNQYWLPKNWQEHRKGKSCPCNQINLKLEGPIKCFEPTVQSLGLKKKIFPTNILFSLHCTKAKYGITPQRVTFYMTNVGMISGRNQKSQEEPLRVFCSLPYLHDEASGQAHQVFLPLFSTTPRALLRVFSSLCVKSKHMRAFICGKLLCGKLLGVKR